MYVVLGDALNYSNKTMYKFDSSKVQTSLQQLFKLDLSVASGPKKEVSPAALLVNELLVVP